MESDKPKQETQTSMSGQLPHRDQDPRIKGQDTDFPEPGENPEYSGEPQEPEFSTEDESERREGRSTSGLIFCHSEERLCSRVLSLP